MENQIKVVLIEVALPDCIFVFIYLFIHLFDIYLPSLSQTPLTFWVPLLLFFY